MAALRWALVVALLLSGCTAEPPEPPDPAVSTRPAPPPGPADGTSEPVADPVYPAYGNPAIDVLRYSLALSWAPSTRTLRGTATLTIRVVRDLTEITLDLASGYTVEGATIDGAPASVRRAPDDVIIAGAHQKAGSRITVAVRYAGTPKPVAFPGDRPDLSTTGANVGPGGELYAMHEPYGAFTWFPCSDQPSDKALYDAAITAPEGWSAASTGGFEGVEGGAHRFRATEPVATYLVALAVQPMRRHDAAGPRGVPLTYWVRPGDEAAMLPTLRQSPQILAWLEARLGPYPFSSGGVVIVPSTSGLETQTMITLGPIRGPQAVPVLVHEYAHQWFGDTVTPRTWRDMWLNEGFATYLQMMYSVDRLGGDLAATLRTWQEQYTASRAVAGPPGAYRAEQFGARNVYFGPALMLHELRGLLGEALFAGVLHDWPQHHRHSVQDRASFTAWINAYTGRDLSPVLAKWLD